MRCELCERDALRKVQITKLGFLWLCARHIIELFGEDGH